MTLTELITTVVAVVGAVLGILNHRRISDLGRVKLKVEPVNYISLNGGNGPCISVTNLSAFPITVESLGYSLSDGTIYIRMFDYAQGWHLPKKMEPRTSITFYFPPETVNDPRLAKVTHAFAKTACGEKFTGTSPTLEAMIARCRSLAESEE